MYGGPDYGHPQYINDATQSIAQAGSTFKAFTLVAALESGITLDSPWDGHSGRVFTDVNGSKTRPVPNEDGKSYGHISLLQATEDSVNTVFMDVENQPEVGALKVVDAARRAGIPDDVVIDPVLSATLGVASPTPARHGGGLRHLRPPAGRAPTPPRSPRSSAPTDWSCSTRPEPGSQARHDGPGVVSPGRLRPAEGRDERHRHHGPQGRPPGRRQDRDDGQQPVGLVRRLHPAAGDVGRAVPYRAGREDPQVDERCRRPRPGQRRELPGLDLDQLHDQGGQGDAGRRVHPAIPARVTDTRPPSPPSEQLRVVEPRSGSPTPSRAPSPSPTISSPRPRTGASVGGSPPRGPGAPLAPGESPAAAPGILAPGDPSPLGAARNEVTAIDVDSPSRDDPVVRREPVRASGARRRSASGTALSRRVMAVLLAITTIVCGLGLLSKTASPPRQRLDQRQHLPGPVLLRHRLPLPPPRRLRRQLLPLCRNR